MWLSLDPTEVPSLRQLPSPNYCLTEKWPLSAGSGFGYPAKSRCGALRSLSRLQPVTDTASSRVVHLGGTPFDGVVDDGKHECVQLCVCGIVGISDPSRFLQRGNGNNLNRILLFTCRKTSVVV